MDILIVRFTWLLEILAIFSLSPDPEKKKDGLNYIFATRLRPNIPGYLTFSFPLIYLRLTSSEARSTGRFLSQSPVRKSYNNPLNALASFTLLFQVHVVLYPDLPRPSGLHFIKFLASD